MLSTGFAHCCFPVVNSLYPSLRLHIPRLLEHLPVFPLHPASSYPSWYLVSSRLTLSAMECSSALHAPNRTHPWHDLSRIFACLLYVFYIFVSVRRKHVLINPWTKPHTHMCTHIHTGVGTWSVSHQMTVIPRLVSRQEEENLLSRGASDFQSHLHFLPEILILTEI